jgi:hypothetical protein
MLTPFDEVAFATGIGYLESTRDGFAHKLGFTLCKELGVALFCFWVVHGCSSGIGYFLGWHF